MKSASKSESFLDGRRPRAISAATALLDVAFVKLSRTVQDLVRDMNLPDSERCRPCDDHDRPPGALFGSSGAAALAVVWHQRPTLTPRASPRECAFDLLGSSKIDVDRVRARRSPRWDDTRVRLNDELHIGYLSSPCLEISPFAAPLASVASAVRASVPRPASVGALSRGMNLLLGDVRLVVFFRRRAQPRASGGASSSCLELYLELDLRLGSKSSITPALSRGTRSDEDGEQ